MKGLAKSSAKALRRPSRPTPCSASPTEPDSLTSRVRKEPFLVVLLDEFEKSHSNVWDLFLQAFDEGRLTDAMGQVADLRLCLIILASNLGATGHRSMGLGFAP